MFWLWTLAGYYWRKQLRICGLRHTLDIVTDCLPSDKMYTNSFEYPDKGKRTVALEAIEPYGRQAITAYDVLAVPVKHSAPIVGYQVNSPDGKSLFYTGETTQGVSDCWQHISPQLLITEVAGPDKYEDWLKKGWPSLPKASR